MPHKYHNRAEAGRLLAERLVPYRNLPEVVVAAIPGGGVPVAREVARALDAPLKLLPVQRVALPGCKDVTLAALASGAIVTINEDAVEAWELPGEVVNELVDVEQQRLERTADLLDVGGKHAALRGRIVILVDDGVVSGTTIHAAIALLRREHPLRIVLAVPAGAPEACAELADGVDELVFLDAPSPFGAVRQQYDDPVTVSSEALQTFREQSPPSGTRSIRSSGRGLGTG